MVFKNKEEILSIDFRTDATIIESGNILINFAYENVNICNNG